MQNQPFDEAVELSESESVEEPPKGQTGQGETLNMEEEQSESGGETSSASEEEEEAPPPQRQQPAPIKQQAVSLLFPSSPGNTPQHDRHHSPAVSHTNPRSNNTCRLQTMS